MKQFGGAGAVLAPDRTGEAMRIVTLETALERIANSKHGDRQWMAGVAREALREAARYAAGIRE
jgi:hypothetical protein